MNYYERHLGDYAKDAGHLSMLEHGAYTLLLDRYYTTEQPIPVDQAHRICRARTKEERAAVDVVLAEFFEVVDGAWCQSRVSREITKMQAKVKAAQENGKHGGRPKKTEQKPSGLLPGSDLETQQKALQSPDTRHQNPIQSGKDGGEPLHPPLALSAEPDLTGHQPTKAGLACRAIKAAGVIDVNPGHAGLLRLLDGGVTVDELASTAAELVGKGKGKFALLLATVEGRRVDAANAGSVAQAAEVVDPGAMAAEKTRREMAEFAARPVSKPPEALKSLVQKLKVTA